VSLLWLALIPAAALSRTAAASTWYLAPNGSDANPCTLSAPCTSFRKGYAVASPGDGVLVTCGGAATCHYPDQLIPFQLAKAGIAGRCVDAQVFADGSATKEDHSACITFRPSASESITVGTTSHSIVVEVPYVRLSGLATPLGTGAPSPEYGIEIGANPGRTNTPCTAWNVHDVVVDRATASVVNVRASSYVYVANSAFGPHFATTTTGTSQVQGCNGNGGPDTHADHTVFRADTWHDYFVSTPGAHTECLHWDNGDVGVVARSRFLNCGQQDVSVETQGGSAPSIRDLLIENNVFDRACSHPNPGDPCGVVSGGTTTLTCHVASGRLGPVTVRFNSYDAAGHAGGSIDATGCQESQIAFEGNTMTGPLSPYACPAQQGMGWRYRANVFFSGVPCGQDNALNVDPATVYANPSFPLYDYSELPGAVSIDFVPDAVARPTTDITGAPRPQGIRTDAGAFER
jgi:hypothetical protein